MSDFPAEVRGIANGATPILDNAEWRHDVKSTRFYWKVASPYRNDPVIRRKSNCVQINYTLYQEGDATGRFEAIRLLKRQIESVITSDQRMNTYYDETQHYVNDFIVHPFEAVRRTAGLMALGCTDANEAVIRFLRPFTETLLADGRVLVIAEWGVMA